MNIQLSIYNAEMRMFAPIGFSGFKAPKKLEVRFR